jgi:16S rRNA (guanine527-N7)-methyltransferase
MDDRVLGALAEARALGFLGPGPLDAHVASAEAFVAAIGPDLAGPALDLGSGGGVPGLLLAERYADVPWVLLDVHRRRTSFLARAVAGLGWTPRVTVVRAPAEEAAHESEHRERYELVVSRSFGPPAVTAECAAGFLAADGRLIVAEPPVPDPQRWPMEGLDALGYVEAPAAPGVAVFRRTGSLSAEVPRAWRAMERHPAW